MLNDEEHGEVLRIASIMFLGYLLPHSTANEFFLLKHHSRDFSKAACSMNVQDEILNMPLEERLEKSIRGLDPTDFGEMNSLVDPYREVAFDSLVENALGPLLEGRPFHRQQVDLLHIFAMSIHPQPTMEYVLDSFRDHADPEGVEWQLVHRLVGSKNFGCYFQLHYGHRVKIIQLLVKNLVLPPLEDDSVDMINPLLFGALPHLQASLRAFAQGAMTQWDAHVAYAGIATVSVLAHNLRVIEDTWDFLLHLMVDNKANYQCQECGSRRRVLASWCSHADVPEEESKFCPHSARGHLLSAMIVRSCSTRDHVDPGLLHKMTTSLADAIEFQVFTWTKPDNEEEEKEEKPSVPAPCLLASLIFTAKHVFLFQPSRLRDDDEDPCESILSSSIQLLNHPDGNIASEAATTLHCAFLHDTGNKIAEYSSRLYPALSLALQKDTIIGCSLSNLIGLACEKANECAPPLFDQLLGTIQARGNHLPYVRILSSIALNCPTAALKRLDELVSLQTATESGEKDQYLMVALLATRQAQFFAGKQGRVDKLVARFACRNTEYWEKYIVMRHSLVTGNNEAAKKLCTDILGAVVDENNFLWISALQKLATAEAIVSQEASHGIPSAVPIFHEALSRIQALRSFQQKTDLDYNFQIRWLLLRLDFLDLVLVLRQLTREMRLTGSGPAKNTRNYMYLRNSLKAFETLAFRFSELGRQHGLYFHHGQSKVALSICRSLSLFVAAAGRAAFSDILTTSKTTKTSLISDIKDLRHPMVALICRLDELVVQPMTPSVDPMVRSTAMLELLDGLLMAPFPLPRDLLLPKIRSQAALRLFKNATPLGSASLNHVNVWPSVGFSFHAIGRIPVHLRKRADLPISNVVVWFHITFVGPLEDDEAGRETKDEEDQAAPIMPKQIPRLPNVTEMSPQISCVNTNGTFSLEVECPPFQDEGNYKIEARLGCQDSSGEKWELNFNQDGSALQVQVTRTA